MANKKYNILIIEDNEINRGILNAILEEDFNLLFAENGQIGMDLLRKHTTDIDMVLLDIVMPVMDGYAVLDEVRKDHQLKDIPIIITTGNEQVDEEVKCLQMGASDFVRKPYNPVAVRLRVDSIFRLRESNQSNLQKTRFIQQMSHEIRTPLNAIMGFGQLLSDSEMMSVEERRECSDYIVNNSQMLMRMIDDMLALSDIDNGVIRVDKKSSVINETCRSAITTITFCVPDGVEIHYHSDVDDNYIIETDAKRVQQILINLLTNACKFTSQGEINVTATNKEREGFFTLSVADNGPGIPADKVDAIFDRFYKIDPYTPGSGLGLSISLSIAKFLNGKLWLDTSYTNGARFVLDLPL